MKKLWRRLCHIIQLTQLWRRVLRTTRHHLRQKGENQKQLSLFIVLAENDCLQTLFPHAHSRESLYNEGNVLVGSYQVLGRHIVLHLTPTTNSTRLLRTLRMIWALLSGSQLHISVLTTISYRALINEAPSIECEYHELKSYPWILIIHSMSEYPGLLTFTRQQTHAALPSTQKELLWHYQLQADESTVTPIMDAWSLDVIRQLSKEPCVATRFSWFQALMAFPELISAALKTRTALSPLQHCYFTTTTAPFPIETILQDIPMRVGALRSRWHRRCLLMLGFCLSSIIACIAWSYHQQHQILFDSVQVWQHPSIETVLQVRKTLEENPDFTLQQLEFDKTLITWLLKTQFKPVVLKMANELENLAQSHAHHPEKMPADARARLLALTHDLRGFDVLCQLPAAERKKCWDNWQKQLPQLTPLQFQTVLPLLQKTQVLPWSPHTPLMTKIEVLFKGSSIVDLIDRRLIERLRELWPHDFQITTPVSGLFMKEGREHYFKILREEWHPLLAESGAHYHQLRPEQEASVQNELAERYWRGYRQTWEAWLTNYPLASYHTLKAAQLDLSRFGRKPTPYDQFLATIAEPSHSDHLTGWRDFDKLAAELPDVSQCLFALQRDIAKMQMDSDIADSAFHYARSLFGNPSAHHTLYRCVLLAEEAVMPIHSANLQNRISRILNANILSAWTQILNRAKTRLDKPLRELLDYHKSHLGRCFPLAETEENCDPEILTQYYQPKVGMLDQAFAKHLGPFLQPIADEWRPRTWLGKSFPLDHGVIATLHQQKERQKVLFATDSSAPSHRYSIRELPTPDAAVMILTNNDERFIYRNGKESWRNGVWLSQGHQDVAEIRLEDENLQTLAVLRFHGAWAWLRLLAAAHRTHTNAREVHLTWDLAGKDRTRYQVAYEVRVK